jgi:predicted metal-dependent hydrolase
LVGDVERSVVQFGGTSIPFTVRRGKRQKTVAIAIDPQGDVLVRAPVDTPVEKLDRIVHRKASWIVERLKRTSDLPPRPSEREFVSGETFLYLGRQYRLRVERGDEGVRLERGRLVVSAPRNGDVRAALVGWYRRRAVERLPVLVEEWAPRVGVTVRGVLVREQRRRWGSCDDSGVLRFNWRIVQAPRRLVEYVVVHELVHLVHRDHTKGFWAALGRVLPDYERRRGELRRVGERLTW